MRTRRRTPRGSSPSLVEARDGDVAATTAAIERAFGARPFNITPIFGPDDIEPAQEAIEYEARAALAFAALAGLAAAVFAGQAIARQSRREWADLATLNALGLSRRQALLTAAMAGALTAVGAVDGGRGRGDRGVARSAAGRRPHDRARPRRHVDWLPLTIGCGLVLAVVLLATCVPVARMSRRTRTTATTRMAQKRGMPLGLLPPPATVGVTMAVNGGRGGNGLPFGAAIATVALAVAAFIAAIGLGSSLTALTGTPERFGAPWDFSFAQPYDAPLDGGRAETFLTRSDDVAAAAGIVGTDIEIDGRVYWAQSFQPVPGVEDVVDPPITAGREPVRADEIALGAITMRQLGVGIGDTVRVASTVTSSEPSPMTVVGTTLINDTYEGSPGLGAVVTPEWLAQAAPEASTPDPYVARLEPGADRAAFRAAIESEFGATVNGPVEQTAIRNVERIRTLPLALAAMVGVLAISSLAHAVVLSARRHRGQLAVLRTLGFSRGQAAAAVRWQATVLGLGRRGHRAPARRRRRPLGLAGRWPSSWAWRAGRSCRCWLIAVVAIGCRPRRPRRGRDPGVAGGPAAAGRGLPGRVAAQSTRVRTRSEPVAEASSEPAALQRGQEDLLVRRAAAVGRVGEHVVDRQRAADARRAAPIRRSRRGPARRRGRRR